jgi:hypothetical protein
MLINPVSHDLHSFLCVLCASVVNHIRSEILSSLGYWQAFTGPDPPSCLSDNASFVLAFYRQ